MSSRASPLLYAAFGLALLLVGGLLVSVLLRATSDEIPIATQPDGDNRDAPMPGVAAAAPEAVAQGVRQAGPVATDRTAVETGPEPGQGLRGLVVDDDSQPLVGAEIHLLESAGNDPFGLTVLRHQRHSLSPLASTATGADGTFAVGLPVVQDKLYDLCVVSPAYAIVRRGGLKMLAGQWHDLGAIKLTPGATLRGRVTVEGRIDIPVPQATVTLLAGTAFEDAALRSLPGFENGICTTVDAGGYYELRQAPGRGVVQVSAVAPGFARVLRQNIELTTEHAIELNFGLPPGQIVSGYVLDRAGRPVAGASIQAWPQQAPDGALLARSEDNGHFEVMGLLTSKYRVRVVASGYQNHDERDVVAGRTDLRIVLATRSRIHVRVLTPERTVVRSYQLALRRYFAEAGGQIGLVADVPEQRVRLDDRTDFAELEGVPLGTFTCQVTADGYAKTLSQTIVFDAQDSAARDNDVRNVDVVLSAGVTLRGRVTDEAGAPLADAMVATQADGISPDNPAWRVFSGALPDRITVQKTVTDAAGIFVLKNLAFAKYQLEIEHGDACRTVVSGLDLATVGEQTLPPIRLPAGALVVGRATVGGRTAGQMKIVLSTQVPAGQPASGATTRIETVTDSEGLFCMPRRVPPGTYDLRAAVVGITTPEAQIFQQILQLQRSSITFSVAPGQRQVERDIDLPSDH